MDEILNTLTDVELSEVSGGKKVECFVYTVKKGDTLSHLARVYSTTVNMLMKLNGIEDKDLIKIGQKLYIPVTD